MNNLEYKENKMNLRKAFTLAEVLITVTIIGIVAALTIPSFMSDTSQRSNAVALKKAISALDQAVDMSRAESKFLMCQLKVINLINARTCLFISKI